MKAHLLLVEDDPALLAILKAAADYGGFASRAVSTGEDAVSALSGGGFDAVLLDLGLPDYDGKELLVALRGLSDIPIIVVSGRGSESDKIEALDLGADDFVAKPFLPGELLARVRAALRRYRGGADGRAGSVPPQFSDRHPMRIGFVTLDPFTRTAEIQETSARFNEAEYRVLHAIAAGEGGIVSRDDLLDALYEEEPPTDSNVVDVYISRVRSKLRELPSGEDLIATVRGQGWRLKLPD